MNNNYTHMVFVLDRSGSMYDAVTDTIGGVNNMIDEQKKQEGKCTVSTLLFNNFPYYLNRNVNINQATRLNSQNFVASGGTALLDAVGKAIDDTGNFLRDLPEYERPNKVLFVIMTDGEENSSKEFSHRKVKDMIKHQEDVYSWNFVFMGADFDAVKQGTNLGASIGNAFNFSKKNVRQAYNALSEEVVKYRSYNVSKVDNLVEDLKDKF